MKKILTIALIFPILFLSSQEMDQEYLNSLPETVRQDVLDKMEAKQESEKPIYRRASSAIDKPEQLDEDVETRFGSNFFDTMQTSFMPINEPNLNSTYILDFGDVIEIQLIGQEDSIQEYIINRDGSINISDLGKIVLSGLSLNEASSLIKNKVKNIYIGTEAFITLKNIRDISILISGNAYNPGIYTLNGNSNMLHALTMAGGINEFGSYRNISLIRNGDVIEKLDLYEVLINGMHNINQGLRSGDSIVVHPIEKMVSIETGVIRPGKYELIETDKLDDLIKFANGFNKNADKSNMQIKRVNRGITQGIDIKLEQLETFKLNDGDSFYVREFKVNSIIIDGAVKNPGNYNVPIGTKLSEAIMLAGGYDQTAYPFGGSLENKRALKINQDAKDKLYDAFLNNIITNSNSVSSDNANMGLILEQIKNAEVTGRVIAEFDIDVIKKNPSLDTILEDADRIVIPNITQQVYIQGEINNPGAVRYAPGKDLDFYINASGGLLKNADKENIFILHPNGETQTITSSSRLSFLITDKNRELLYPGSVIYVPQSADFTNSLETAAIWAPILSSVALSLTSLSVLNNN